MKNLIVASFKEESKAVEALHKLNELDSFGDITIYDLEFDKRIDEQIGAIEADIAQQKAALKEAAEKEKKRIETKIADLNEQRRTKIAEFVAKNKQIQKDIDIKAADVVAKFQTGIDAIGTGISEELKKERLERIKRRIDKHEGTLKELNAQLTELQG